MYINVQNILWNLRGSNAIMLKKKKYFLLLFLFFERKLIYFP